ncbi:hypothetical protein S40293_11297 [Stachybotrys chartarum IBT 40293]|nr:hypothetical protein S40293_11297 [Stachybotrys chartarum IBT 40293]
MRKADNVGHPTCGHPPIAATSNSLKPQKVSPLIIGPRFTTSTHTIKIEQSLLQSIAIGGIGFLRFFQGFDINSGERVLALTDSSESPAFVPAEWCLPVLEPLAPYTLVSVAAHLLAGYVLSLTAPGNTLLVHEADVTFEAALRAQASRKNVKPVFVASDRDKVDTGGYIYLHPGFSHHPIQSAVPCNATVFISFSQGLKSDILRETIAKHLAPGCLRISKETLLGNAIRSYSQSNSIMNLLPRLEQA